MSASADQSLLSTIRASPRAVRILSGMVAVEAAALAVIGVVQSVLALTAEHQMPVAAIALMSLLYIGYGLWLLGSARALLAGHLWPRALILLTQVFLAIISTQMASLWGWPLAIWAVVYAVLTVSLLFTPMVQKHLLAAENRRRVEPGSGSDLID